MAIKGALFDCDGTLIDSMPMWTNCCVSLLERYGISDAMRVFLEHESLDMDKKCYWYHDNLGIGKSGEALYEELWDMVSEAYDRDVSVFEGCHSFLDDLNSRGVPCAIVSSTPTALVEHALERHGLARYFQKVVFVGDVGRAKVHGDCYLAACRMLGTPLEETWVFEDAPFGVRSAVRAGFPTVAVLNDHDGRDEAFLETWATVVARSYEELSVSRLEKLRPRVTRALVVAGSPQPSSKTLLKDLAADADLVIAADAGINALRDAGIAPHVYCGDADSAKPEAIEWARADGTRLDMHPVEKDDTDLGLAFSVARQWAEKRGSALRVCVTCASGGRPDHALGVWGVLANHATACPRLVEDGFECRILSPAGDASWDMHEEVGTTVSAIALAPHTVVSERGLRWDLDDAELGLLDDRGISNRVTAERARVVCESGTLAVFVLKS